MGKANFKLKSFRLKKRIVNNLDKIHKETNLTYNAIFSEMIRSYFKKLEKRRKAQRDDNK